MQVKIGKEDKVVHIDGEVLKFDFILDDNIWAVQWDGTEGHIEYNDGTPNETITDITPFQSIIDGHATEKAKIEQEEADRIANMSYADKRMFEYPTFPDQFDDIFHNGIDGWKSTIQAVKDKYPKE
jgi:hypothetical protein